MQLIIKKMTNEGWIKLYRKITENCLWEIKPFDKCRAFIYILIHANWKEVTLIIRGKPQIVEKGSFRTSIGVLSKKWGWSENKVKRFLKLLVELKMITTKGDANGTVIKVINYNKYQAREEADELTDEPTDDSTGGPISEPQNKKRKKYNKQNKHGFSDFSNQRDINFNKLEEQLLAKK